MTIKEALENALTFLEALGYRQGGAIHDDFAEALDRLATKYHEIANEELDV